MSRLFASLFLTLVVISLASAGCLPLKCNTGCVKPHASATCSASGAWEMSGDVDAATLGAIQCELRITGTLSGSAPGFNMNLYGKITAGAVNLGTASLNVDLCAVAATAGYKFTWITFTSITGYLASSKVNNIATSSAPCYMQQSDATSLFLLFANTCTNPPPNPPPTATACNTYTCTNTANCPKPTAAATCNANSGEWEVSGDLSAAALTGTLRCGLNVQGDFLADSSATVAFGYCGNLNIQNCFYFDNPRASLDMQGNAVAVGTTKALMSYSCGVGFFASGSVTNIAGTSPQTCSQIGYYPFNARMEFLAPGTCPSNGGPYQVTPPTGTTGTTTLVSTTTSSLPSPSSPASTTSATTASSSSSSPSPVSTTASTTSPTVVQTTAATTAGASPSVATSASTTASTTAGGSPVPSGSTTVSTTVGTTVSTTLSPSVTTTNPPSTTLAPTTLSTTGAHSPSPVPTTSGPAPTTISSTGPTSTATTGPSNNNNTSASALVASLALVVVAVVLAL